MGTARVEFQFASTQQHSRPRPLPNLRLKMPFVVLQPSPLRPAPPRAAAAAGRLVWAAGTAATKDLAIESYREQRRQPLRIARNATMLENLKRCFVSRTFWERTPSSRKGREQAAAQITEGLRTTFGAFAQQRQGVEKHHHSIGVRVRSLIGSDSCSSTAAGSRSACRRASTSFCDGPVGSRIVRGLIAAGECHELNLVSRQFSPFVIHSSIACRQVSYGWKRRERTSDESITCRWNRETVVRLSRHSKRVYRVASHPHAAVETRVFEAVLRKGALFEFERESGKILLAVAQNRDGKKNWTAIDQSGNTHIVKPQQITYLVPYPEDFEPSHIGKFLLGVETLQDLSLLEFAWEELLMEKVVHVEHLAKILYSQDTPVECYTVHRMLSGNQIFFRCKHKGLSPIYEPRPLAQVRELQQKRLSDERAHKELLSYVDVIKLALQLPQNEKPAESTWRDVYQFHIRTESLKAYALNSNPEPAQKKSAEQVIEVMGLTRNPAVIVNLLIGMGVYPLHVNVDLLKIKNLVEFKKEHIAAVEQLHQSPPVDPDLENRVDLTAMKVYTIDSDDTDEIDDGLSAARLPDGRIKVWIHVADPTRWVSPDDILSREAEYRGTSIYLPTGTIPMFPMQLAAGQLSLQQGRNCCAVTVSVVLLEDGSVAEYSLMNSTICPTYKLSYDNVAELLQMHVAEEPELYLLAEAASCRAAWRKSQGAILTFVPEAEIKVTDPDSIKPSISLDVKDQSVPAMQLVAEMMILCGEVVSLIGEENRLCLPYRGQAPTNFPKRIMSNLPEGPCRAFAMRRLLGSADMSFIRPIPHASLGLPGYVQFTSPIRRYADLLSHYQVKAFIRGDEPPFSTHNVEAKLAMANIRMKDARKLQASAVRYWTIEYLRRQPKDRRYQAVVLRLIRDREVSVLLLEACYRGSLLLSSTPSVGSEVFVEVVDADPRKDVLCLRQC